MRFDKYPERTEVSSDDLMLVHTEEGTKKVTAKSVRTSTDDILLTPKGSIVSYGTCFENDTTGWCKLLEFRLDKEKAINERGLFGLINVKIIQRSLNSGIHTATAINDLRITIRYVPDLSSNFAGIINSINYWNDEEVKDYYPINTKYTYHIIGLFDNENLSIKIYSNLTKYGDFTITDLTYPDEYVYLDFIASGNTPYEYKYSSHIIENLENAIIPEVKTYATDSLKLCGKTLNEVIPGAGTFEVVSSYFDVKQTIANNANNIGIVNRNIGSSYKELYNLQVLSILRIDYEVGTSASDIGFVAPSPLQFSLDAKLRGSYGSEEILVSATSRYGSNLYLKGITVYMLAIKINSEDNAVKIGETHVDFMKV